MGESKGKIAGMQMETVDIVQKIDGSNEWVSRIVETTKDGDMIVMMAKGTGKMERPTMGSFMGEVSFMTQSKKLSWLNNTKGILEGTNDTTKNEAMYKVYASKQQ